MSKKGVLGLGLVVGAIVTLVAGMVAITVFTTNITKTLTAAAGAEQAGKKIERIQQTIDQKCSFHSGQGTSPENPNTKTLELSRIKSVSVSESQQEGANSKVIYEQLSGTQEKNSFCRLKTPSNSPINLDQNKEKPYTVEVSCVKCGDNTKVPKLLVKITEAS